MTEALDIDHLRTWIGREEIGEEVVSEDLARKYHATLDFPGEAPQAGEIVPRLIHFCLAQPAAPTAALGPDGHPARGGFLPPVPLPRRMWAGGAFTFHGDLRVGDLARRVSRIEDVVLKEVRTGPNPIWVELETTRINAQAERDSLQARLAVLDRQLGDIRARQARLTALESENA